LSLKFEAAFCGTGRASLGRLPVHRSAPQPASRSCAGFLLFLRGSGFRWLYPVASAVVQVRALVTSGESRKNVFDLLVRVPNRVDLHREKNLEELREPFGAGRVLLWWPSVFNRSFEQCLGIV